ncbi:MAG TPA: hypothetical protein VMH20_03145 [Verrucomicrobiae bacterium]|nr:hypothetical protein [Verrucomicrobiae bacterium]
MNFTFIFKQLVCSIVVVCLALTMPGLAISQSAPTTPPSNVLPPGGDPWPRHLAYQGAQISVYQPQLQSWSGNLLDAYAAVSIKATDTKKNDYGVIWFTAHTEVDKVNRVVTLFDFQLTKQSFPSLANNGAAYTGAFDQSQSWTQFMPLDQLQASLGLTDVAEKQKRVVVQNNAPRIVFSTVPAVLALIDGQPTMHDVGDSLQKIINTRALILFDLEKDMYYLALMDGWVKASSLQGPWKLAKHDPSRDLNKIKKAALDDDQNQILGNPDQSLKDAYEDGEAPVVYVSTTPAELILTQGEPQFTPLLGTNLLYVTNTGDDIFMDSENSQYYILVAGRWFISPSIANGPWGYIAANTLPPDFAKIPTYSPKASVLASVPGTPQAKEALIANQIPQTATINRAAAQLNLSYFGTPDFQPITGTSMTYAVNSATPVIYVPSGSFYACQGAVWFEGSSPTGPWTVATSVPDIIYTIPASSPIYNVTYAQVYGYTPSVVYVGYTPGYYGTVVSSEDVVVYGTGYVYAPYVTSSVWVPAPVTYGVGASFGWSAVGGWALGFGIGMAVGAACSPWWGPTGWYGWGGGAPAWGWGAYGGAASANYYGHWGNAAYSGTRAAWANPYTGNVGAGNRGSFYNPVTGATGVGGRGYNYNAYTGNYAAGSRGAAYNPSTGVVAGGAHGVYGNAYSGASGSVDRGFAYKPSTGNGIGYNGNNVYADHDGNVYKASPGSGWQQYNNGNWNNVDKSTQSSLSSQSASRDQGAQSWNNFHSGGWGGSSGSDGYSSRGGGGWSGGGWGSGGHSDSWNSGGSGDRSTGGWGGGGWGGRSSSWGDGGFHGGWGGGGFGGRR